ncbi:hypothetical protein B0T16DRAFT_320017 [Cercophora newfieldiana]|uniref:non-specific serine/threonine protein kinase n=1 Tax=Cercophora newfieldiana TaxID=92897 RepID=A0AA39YN02_9PEZI|nr:hypothetical protein B0T16DRAFT_320017 [Cercophora newfieldiana]
MMDRSRSSIIEKNPIGNGLDAFRTSFRSVCESQNLPPTFDSLIKLGYDELQDIALILLSTLRILPAARQLPSGTGRGTLRSDLLRLGPSLDSGEFEFDRIIPLLKSALVEPTDDTLIWKQLYCSVTESTPPQPPRLIASSLQQTPWSRNTSSFANSSEHCKYVDGVLREELGPMYVGLRNFHNTFFGGIAGLEAASEAVFQKCIEGDNPFFRVEGGWRGWPEDADQDRVLAWFADLSENLAVFAEDHKSTPCQRRPLAKPNQLIDGSVGKRKMDVGYVNDPQAGKDSRCHWSQILVPGELKSNRSADIPSEAWRDLARYAREVLIAQDTRRFVLGFTICGSLMRVWMFDRLGGVASEQFDVNDDGLRLVSTILGFLWMSEEELGFDPTIMIAGDQRFIEIERNGSTERLIIEEVMRRAPCIAGRATTCWKAHREEDPRTQLVIKDSWQYVERDEEGEFLREATSKGVVNMARYYSHQPVLVRGYNDIINGVRRGLDITRASNYRPERSVGPPNTSASVSRQGRSSKPGQKRSSSQTGARLPPSKRSCSESPTKTDRSTLPNRAHRRVILRDYGKPIYEASSLPSLLAALEGCIKGHESLRKAGFLHRDISINNLMINEDDGNPSWRSFLIDLDLAIKEQREGASGAKGKTGTRAFMAIGALLGEQHSFMHDLESFFWVLFWICIHYNGPGKDIGPTEFDSWNYESDSKLAGSKKSVIDDEVDFLTIAKESFTPHYQQLTPWVNRLRKKVFPNGGRWKTLQPELYSSMKEILREARKDLNVVVAGGGEIAVS